MRKLIRLSAVLLWVAACNNPSKSGTPPDLDRDGFNSAVDCDDRNPSVHPGATEVCDLIDNNCDGETDEEGALGGETYYVDLDDDGFGDPQAQTQGCGALDNTADNGDDCDDANPSVNPKADEVCNEIDDDCDGLVDNDAGDLYYVDKDGDGYGDPNSVQQLCFGGPLVNNGDDCNDLGPRTYPGAAEVCDGLDNDCDGDIDAADADVVDATTWYLDPDGDGWGQAGSSLVACQKPVGYTKFDGDCDEANVQINPGQDELCGDAIDNDCDGLTDDDSAVDVGMYWSDQDGDGYGDPFDLQRSCDVISDRVQNDKDCDDTDPAVNPTTRWYPDADADGFGSGIDFWRVCQGPVGYVTLDGDCDDTRASIYPGAIEVCDGLDNDCINGIDDGLSTSIFYADRDGDGYGDFAATTNACGLLPGLAENSDDCDDTDALVNPDSLWFADADGDGWGDAAVPYGVAQCAQPVGYVLDDSDCDDTDAVLHPSTEWFYDLDDDGFGVDTVLAGTGCVSPGNSTVPRAGDCDDKDPLIFPGALERCDAVDHDCDGVEMPADAWWDPGFAYRIPLTMVAASNDLSQAPAEVFIDFRGALDALGDAAAFEPSSLRVVLEDCGGPLGQVELSSQFLDGRSALFRSGDASDPVGDQAGDVVFLYDEDGDFNTPEVLAAGSSYALSIYFGSGITAPDYGNRVSASASGITTGATQADLLAGALDALRLGTGPSVAAAAATGNGLYVGGQWLGPAASSSATAAEQGPVLAAVEVQGARSDGSCAFEQHISWWGLAGRPELWGRLDLVTSADCLVDDPSALEWVDGVQPLAWEHGDLVGASSLVAADRVVVGDGSDALTWGWLSAPNSNLYGASTAVSWAAANELSGPNGSASYLVPAGSVLVDQRVFVLLPHTGVEADASFSALLEGVAVMAGAAEGQQQ